MITPMITRAAGFPRGSTTPTIRTISLPILLLLGGLGLTSAQKPAVHPIPAPAMKEFVPASLPAEPGLQCKLYATGTVPEKGIPVSTDHDGFARFYAVRATTSDTVQRLKLDCTNSDGKAYAYTVDLTAEETFAPHPLDLNEEPGSDRPALTGDPMGYSQSELIAAGYGPRPDPSQKEAFARWLKAASVSGRMLNSKGVVTESATVYKEPGGPWTGSVLTGEPNYIATEASFNVPKAIPGGDETTGTEIAIWNGLGGFGTGSGLIQGGVSVKTTTSAATYGTWREYCCGNPKSNAYGGTFAPAPGDPIYSIEWYCDASGNLALHGGYGCTFLQDLKSNAIMSCTSPTGSPCPSVPALPLCSVKNVTNCETVGLAAEFIIENQSPECCGTTAFTDLADQVAIIGSAYSSKTDAYSQTVNSDTAVYLLGDFTNTSSHMDVTLGTAGQTYFNVSQFERISGTAMGGILAESLAVGPATSTSPQGDAWMIGSVITNNNGSVYHWENSAWVQKPGQGIDIAVSPGGDPWLVDFSGKISYWNGSSFVAAPGNACATWIGVGPNAYGSTHGDPWIIGCNGGYYNDSAIYQLQGSTWVKQPGGALRIAVGPGGTPWIVNKAGQLWQWDGAKFVLAPSGPCASDVAVGPMSAPLAGSPGNVWITGCDNGTTGDSIYQLQLEGVWVKVPGAADLITVSPDKGIPWIVTGSGGIFE